MAYQNEHASAQALLHSSVAKEEFDGEIERRALDETSPPPEIQLGSGGKMPKKIIAIDGSNVRHDVHTGYPGAEAALVQVAVVLIDPQRLDTANQIIPSPSVFRDMEQPKAIEAMVPGTNVIGKDENAKTPRRYFRKKLGQALNQRITKNGETLDESLMALATCEGSPVKNICPKELCDRKFNLREQLSQSSCPCNKLEIKPLDTLRLHERFGEERVEARVFDEVRHVLELLTLVNILRFFDGDDKKRQMLADIAIVLDGPLAVFGTPAWMMRPIRSELQRIDEGVRSLTGHGILVLGIEKSGQFMEHLKALDNTGKIAPRTAYALDTRYIHRHIVLRPENADPYGRTTYFGRKILYKTIRNSHVVPNIAMTSRESEDFSNITLEAFPRLADILVMLDELSTHLYPDAFFPLVRAHAHAAIPLTQGVDILQALFQGSVQ